MFKKFFGDAMSRDYIVTNSFVSPQASAFVQASRVTCVEVSTLRSSSAAFCCPQRPGLARLRHSRLSGHRCSPGIVAEADINGEAQVDFARDELQTFRVSTRADEDAVREIWRLAGWSPDEADNEHDTEYVVVKKTDGQALGTGRLLRRRNNVQLDRVFVLREARGRGVGRAVVHCLMNISLPVEGVIYVEATIPELGFYSLLGFEVQGNQYMEGGVMYRHMVYKPPVCTPASDCVGLHHTAIRVLDIERSLAFYGSLGFVVSEKFLTPSGARACFVEGLGVRLEFVESTTGSGLSGVQDWPGFLVFDVTRGCSDLDTFLEHIERRNGGQLNVTGAPANQVVGSQVMSIATVDDPDGLPIDFIRREGHIPKALIPRIDW